VKYIVLVALLLVSAALVISGLALKERFQAGAKTRIAICESENTLRAILHKEHAKKLTNATKYLDAHPNGTKDIPLYLIQNSIRDEQEIVSETIPKSCA
jgi:hypothetical protein